MVAGTLALVVGLLLAAAWDLWRIRQDLRAGQAALDGLSLEAAADTGLTGLAQEAADQLASASGLAHGSLSLRVLGLLPVIDDQVRGIQRMTAVTDQLGQSGLTAAKRIEAELSRATEPAGRVALLDVALEEVDRIAAELTDVDLGRPNGLVGPLRSAHDDLADSIRRARSKAAEGRRLVAPIRDLLQGPSTYLLLAANNAEMAGGAGLALSAGLLQFDAGEIELGEVVPAGDLRLSKTLDLPGDLRQIYSPTGIGIDFRSSTRSPNLPVMGPVIRRMVVERGLEDLDGVLVVDAVTLARLMEVTGDITVDGRTIGARNVLAEVLNENYKQFDTAQDRPERVSYQGEIAKAIFESLTQRQVDAVGLAEALLNAVEGRHLLLWSGDAAVQETWVELGASGALSPRGLMVSFQNYSANKLDWYLRPEAALDVRLLPSGDYRARLTMEMRVPPLEELEGASAYILGPSPARQGVFLTVHLPAEAYDITTPDPKGFRTRGIDPPLQVRTFLTDVPLGTTFEREVHFSLPREVVPLLLLPSARVEPLPLRIDGVATVTDAVPIPIFWLAAALPTADGSAPAPVHWTVVLSTLALLVAAVATGAALRRPVGTAPLATSIGQYAALAALACLLLAGVLALLLSARPR